MPSGIFFWWDLQLLSSASLTWALPFLITLESPSLQPPPLPWCLCIASWWNSTGWTGNTTLQHKYCSYFTAYFLLFAFSPFSCFTFWFFTCISSSMKIDFTLASSSSGLNSSWGCLAEHMLLWVEELVFASECKGGGLHMTKSFLMLCVWWKEVNSCCCTGGPQWELMIPIWLTSPSRHHCCHTHPAGDHHDFWEQNCATVQSPLLSYEFPFWVQNASEPRSKIFPSWLKYRWG